MKQLKVTKRNFANVLLDEQLFSLFVRFNLFSADNNLVLFYETAETLLDMIVPLENQRSLEVFVEGRRKRNSGTFPESKSAHVHQICMTYLVPSAPYYLHLDEFAMRSVASKAMQSPIPISLFDDLLLLVLESLYSKVFPQFVKDYAKDIQDNMDERSGVPKATPLGGVCESAHSSPISPINMKAEDIFNSEVKNLHHRTSTFLLNLQAELNDRTSMSTHSSSRNSANTVHDNHPDFHPLSPVPESSVADPVMYKTPSSKHQNNAAHQKPMINIYSTSKLPDNDTLSADTLSGHSIGYDNECGAFNVFEYYSPSTPVEKTIQYPFPPRVKKAKTAWTSLFKKHIKGFFDGL